MRGLVIGGTGFVGGALVRALTDPLVSTRDPARAKRGSTRLVGWQPEEGPLPLEALRGIDAVFNLGGEPIGEGRWTDAKKRRIRDSRVVGTRNLVAGIAACETRPRVLVSVSAVGFYGDRGDEELDERSAGGVGFLAEVCRDWEQEALSAERLGVRVVCARLGLVLSRTGGALAKMLPPFRMGVGGRLGGGAQWMPWIHLDDVIGLLLHAAERAEVRGAMNVVSPHPVTNREFTGALGAVLRRPTFLPVPGAALRLVFGEMSEILVDSQRALPRVAAQAGYVFRHPELGAALRALVTDPVEAP